MLNKWLKNLIDLFFSSGGSKPGSTDIELANAYIRLAEFQLSRFHKSRDIEWRVHIVFWALIVAFGGSMILAYPFSSEPRLVVIVLALVLLLFVELNCIHQRWSMSIQRKQNKDRDMSFEFRNRAMKLLREESIPPMPCQHAGESGVKLARETSLILSVAVYALLLIQTVPGIWGRTNCPVRISAPAQMCYVRLPVEGTSEIPRFNYLEEITPLKLSDAEVLLRTVEPEPVDELKRAEYDTLNTGDIHG